MASTQHALRTSCVSLRSAKQPRTQFANFPKCKYKVPKVQVFYGQVHTRTPFKCRKCYILTSRQARVLVVQASVAAYLQDLPSRFFSYDLLNARKQICSYQQATYEGNFSSVLNQERCSQPTRLLWSISSCVLFSTRKLCAKAVPEMDFFMQQKHYHKRTTLRTWPWQSQERDAEWLAPTIARLIHGASVLLGT